MKFVLKFSTGKDCHLLMEKLGEPGIDILDMIRKDYPEYDDISTDKITIDTSCPINSYMVMVEISEDKARTSGLFRGKSSVDVTVPEFGLSRFLHFTHIVKKGDRHVRNGRSIWRYQITRSKYEKVIDRIEFKNSVDYRSVVESWIDDGCPTEWHPNKGL